MIEFVMLGLAVFGADTGHRFHHPVTPDRCDRVQVGGARN